MAAILIAFAWRFLLSRAFVRGGTCGDISSQCYARHCPNCDRTTTIAIQDDIVTKRMNTMTRACLASIPKSGTANSLLQLPAMVRAFAKHSFSQLTERLHAQLGRWKKTIFLPHKTDKDPLTLSLSPPARLAEPASQRGRIRLRMRLGERTLEFPLRLVLASLLPVRTRLRVRQQKMQARQGVLARRRTG